MTFSKDSKTLASGDTDNIVRLWDIRKKRIIAIFKAHTNGIIAMAFTPDGNILATGSADGTIRFWDVNTRKTLSTFAIGHTELVRSVSFSPDSAKISIAHYNGTVEKWDIKTKRRLNLYNKFPQHLTSALELSPDGKRLACHNIDGRISFNSEGWRTIIEFLGNDRTRLFNIDSAQELPHLTEVFGDMAFSPDNKILACKSSHNKEILLSDVHTGTELYRIHLAERRGPLIPN